MMMMMMVITLRKIAQKVVKVSLYSYLYGGT